MEKAGTISNKIEAIIYTALAGYSFILDNLCENKYLLYWTRLNQYKMIKSNQGQRCS